VTTFEFATAGRIVFGDGCAASVAGWAAAFGSHALVVTGRDPGRAEWLVEALQQQGSEVVLLCVNGEPDLAFVSGGAELARRRSVHVVVGIGGGSALDGAKAIAALATNAADPLGYLEVVGSGQSLVHAPLPLIAVPTTAGTGSEVSGTTVIADTERGQKFSLRHPHFNPARVAILDPLSLASLPASVAAHAGMDAFVHALEDLLNLIIQFSAVGDDQYAGIAVVLTYPFCQPYHSQGLSAALGVPDDAAFPAVDEVLCRLYAEVLVVTTEFLITRIEDYEIMD